jgi:hypothetical protein
MKPVYREILIILACVVLGYGISKLVLSYFKGPPTEEQTNSLTTK